ncbi:CubicO group peptidase (beta-lactamase class C family) [Paenibacillus turicensis]|uniref:CubicO group peptidase (Beta-lactamase class C family) n=1 Tax=Paenibacillus turicensis TaxID=160487 RepID=A0ABS4FMY7_9BACL|nr:serine hydrolase [Paenibacillus turicensis]MBP1903952.1 CubicO group peptidase (beta-lactamase class C family) [Paenibacillus turicensis]
MKQDGNEVKEVKKVKEELKKLEEIILKEYGNIAGIVVLKNGDIRYEQYFNDCLITSPIHVFSVTKSIISALFGIAIDQGLIKSVDQKVLDFFPEYEVEQADHIIQNVTIKHLLTMTTPYQYEEEPYIQYFSSQDWVKFSLGLVGGQGEIGQFRYTPLIGPDILSGILVRATGKTVLDFATENLFSPLGISVKQNIFFHSQEEQLSFLAAKDRSGWVTDPNGVNTAGWGLTLTVMDMAKLGQLYLYKGNWNGKQLLSASWIQESTREHSRATQLNLAYGYLWWIEEGKSFAAVGDSGNVIYVNTEKQMVVSIASLYTQETKDRLEFIKKYVEPLFCI